MHTLDIQVKNHSSSFESQAEAQRFKAVTQEMFSGLS